MHSLLVLADPDHVDGFCTTGDARNQTLSFARLMRGQRCSLRSHDSRTGSPCPALPDPQVWQLLFNIHSTILTLMSIRPCDFPPFPHFTLLQKQTPRSCFLSRAKFEPRHVGLSKAFARNHDNLCVLSGFFHRDGSGRQVIIVACNKSASPFEWSVREN
jgi:hypothetical protein